MEDERIVILYWERSETAISETSSKYGRYCNSIAFNILNNKEDSEECENDTYAAAWDSIPPSRPANLKAFLGRITRNISLDKYDYNTAKKRNSEFDAVLCELEECIASPEDIESHYEQGQIAKCISSFLHSEEKENRFLFIRRYWYCDSIVSISNRFGMSESKVKSKLFRIRKKLKIYLEKEGIM